MARTNVPVAHPEPKTHEGAVAARQRPLVELERTVASCLLWEQNFYEAGDSVAARIAQLCEAVPAQAIADLAIKARFDYKLRHAPLWLCRQLIRLHTGEVVAGTIAKVVHRPDEAAELVSLYWQHNTDRLGRRQKHRMLPAAMKRGLARAFRQWDAYQLAKWNRENAIELRHVLFLVHANPLSEGSVTKVPATRFRGPVLRTVGGKADLWDRLIRDALPTPDTWEVGLSAARTDEDKRAAWTRLLENRKLPYLALLQNVRNLHDVGVAKSLVGEALVAGAPESWALPYRFLAAAKACPAWEDLLDAALLAVRPETKLPGETCLVLDVSGSMRNQLSAKSTLDRIDAACGLAILARQRSEAVTIYATGGNDRTQKHATMLIPARRGMALRDAIRASFDQLGGGGIFLVQCMSYIAAQERRQFQRVLVFTDEQDCDITLKPSTAVRLGTAGNYIQNVAPYKPGIASDGGWTRINGWSERALDWLVAEEAIAQANS